MNEVDYSLPLSYLKLSHDFTRHYRESDSRLSSPGGRNDTSTPDSHTPEVDGNSPPTTGGSRVERRSGKVERDQLTRLLKWKDTSYFFYLFQTNLLCKFIRYS